MDDGLSVLGVGVWVAPVGGGRGFPAGGGGVVGLGGGGGAPPTSNLGGII